MNDFFPIIIVLLGLLAAGLALRLWPTGEETTHRSFKLSFPRSLDADHVQGFVRSLSALRGPWWRRALGPRPTVTFETESDPNRIQHRVVVSPNNADAVTSQLRAIPRLRLLEHDAARDSQITHGVELRLTNERASLRVDEPGFIAGALLASLRPLDRGERVLMQIVASPTSRRLPRRPQGLTSKHKRRPEMTPEQYRALRDKLSGALFSATIRIGVRAATGQRRRHLLARSTGILSVVSSPHARLRRRVLPATTVARRMRRARGSVLSAPSLLNERELAALLAWPQGEVTVAGVDQGSSPQLPPDPQIPSANCRVLGHSTFPGSERALGITDEASLSHVLVTGPTGTGKSTLLLNLITQDMQRGAGVAVFDPKGDLVRDALARVPAFRVDDVIVIDPSDSHVVGFNFLSGSDNAPEFVADAMVAILKRLYASSWGPRTEDIIRATFLTLAREPGMTLAEAPLLLTDAAFRRRLVGRIDDPVGLEAFWGWYEALSDGERAHAIAPTLNKIRALVLRTSLRHIVGQATSGFDMETVIAERRILLVSLAKGTLGEDASALLGSLLLARLWQAVQSRISVASTARAPFFAFLDEFQNYLQLPLSVGDALAEARSYGLGLTLAHQNLGQLGYELRQVVLANARTKVMFQPTADDAATFARELAPLVTPEDLRNLGPREVVISPLVGARVVAPTTAVTNPPAPASGNGPEALAASRKRYARPRSDVEAEIRARHGDRAGHGPIARIRRA